MRADRVLGLEDDDFAPGHGEGARHRQADHTGTDYYAFNFFHGRGSKLGCAL